MARRGLARFDDDYRVRWGDLLGGVDEAGRGPLARPVVAACVVLRPRTRIPGGRDSKVMTAAEREEARVKIPAKALATGGGGGCVMEVEGFDIPTAPLPAI